MPLLSILASTAKIGSVQLDASIEENHQKRNDVTDHPVEEGTDITDNVRPKPDAITITGQVSNHPLARLADLLSDADTTQGRADTAYGDLLFIADNAILVTVVTTLNTYEDMVIESLDVPRNAKLGNVLRFTAQLKNIRTVKSGSAAAPNTDAQNVKPKVSKGKQPAAPAPAQDSSFGYNLLFGAPK